MGRRMSDWSIESFERVGPVRFGMSREEVAAALGGSGTEFQKGFSDTLTEAFNGVGLHVYYDREGHVEFVEAFPPAEPSYNGVPLMRSDAKAILADLDRLGLKPRDDGQGGLWFDEPGFALFAPDGEKNEGVSIFRKGYDTGA